MKRLIAASGLVVALALGLAGLHSRPAHAGDDDDEHEGDGSRARQGFLISPVKIHLGHRDPALVGLGSYLVNAVAGCTDCHTFPNYAPGGDPYLGQPKKINADHFLAGGRPFGPFVSRNLTPEAPDGRPANLTFAQFEEVMRVGTDFDHAHPKISALLQVMPWPVYQNMSDRDLRAIYEYLSSIPHAEPAP